MFAPVPAPPGGGSLLARLARIDELSCRVVFVSFHLEAVRKAAQRKSTAPCPLFFFFATRHFSN